MPTITTRGAASAQGFGFAGGKGPSYWLSAYYNPDNTSPVANGVIFLNNASQVVTLGRVGPGDYSGILTQTKDGVVVSQVYQTANSLFPNPDSDCYYDSVNNILYYAVGSAPSGGSLGAAKLNMSTNSFSWIRTTNLSAGASNSSLSYACAADSSGNVYAAGALFENAPCCVSNSYNTIVKYNSAGTFQWARLNSKNPSSGGNYYRAIAIDSSSNITAAGYYWFQPYGAAVLISFNSSGTQLWQTRLINGTNSLYIYDMVIDSSNNYYVCGFTSASAAFVAKFNSSGALQWSRSITSGTGIGAYKLTIDSSANVYVIVKVNDGTTGFHMLKYDSSGNIQWQRYFTSSSSSSLNTPGSITFLNSENSIVFSCTFTSTSLGNGTNRFIMKYPANGSKTGTYSLAGRTVTISASSLTDSAASYTTAAGDNTAVTKTYTTTVQTPPTYSTISYNLSLTTI